MQIMWKVTNGDQTREIALPSNIVDSRPFRARIGGEELHVRWCRHRRVLYVRDPSGKGKEKVVRLRDHHIDRYPAEATADARVIFAGAGGGDEVVFESAVERFVPGQENRASAGADGARTLKAPMAGKVLKLLVKDGDEVKKGEPVIIIEAMKMENRIPSPGNGRISGVAVSDGDQVAVGQALLSVSV